MRKKLAAFTLALFMLLLATVVSAQQQEVTNNRSTDKTSATATLTEPEWPGRVYQLAADGKLVELESQTGQLSMKGKFGGVSGVAFLYNGAAAKMRVRPDAEFIVKIGEGVDPAVITLNQVQPNLKKDNRSMLVGKVSGMTVTEPPGKVELTFTPLGRDSVRIKATKPLPAGEYGFRAPRWSGNTFLFGVD
jgi:hypothetical protein